MRTRLAMAIQLVPGTIFGCSIFFVPLINYDTVERSLALATVFAENSHGDFYFRLGVLFNMLIVAVIVFCYSIIAWHVLRRSVSGPLRGKSCKNPKQEGICREKNLLWTIATM